MSRLARINTIWRKELRDTLRDRRTLIAMILVPIILYPAMIIGSLQGFEYQITRLRTEEYHVGVLNEATARWLRHVIDTDGVRQPGYDPNMTTEEVVTKSETGELAGDENEPAESDDLSASPREAAREGVRRVPPPYQIDVYSDPNLLVANVLNGITHVGVVLPAGLPANDDNGSVLLTLVTDQTDVRSQTASAGLEGIFDRYAKHELDLRLKRRDLTPAFVEPVQLHIEAVATPEKVGGSILGQIVPLILIVMTITGAIYPAIDLTAGERERGTLETLMVAPVPTVDLIAGKFVVVALVGMLSALLNLLSIGGTVYLGGLGSLLAQGSPVVIPINSLPWVLLIMIPLAVMFSALLLAVCSFARSFKEAQNYVMPVMVAALIPAVIGVLPGTRLEGPLLVMPVTNITILTRDLFMGKFDYANILLVTLSTTLYAAAAVAVAAKLFGQEAVLFADSGSIKTIFRRRFFKVTERPGTAQALLLLAGVFSANYFIQASFLSKPSVLGTWTYWLGIGGLLVTLFLLLPIGAAAYSRVRLKPAFNLRLAPFQGWVAALCIGVGAPVLTQAWMAIQKQWITLPPEMEQVFAEMMRGFEGTPAWVIVFFLAVLPGVCEEFFFRGYALSGVRGTLGKIPAVFIVALAFGIFHGSVQRLVITTSLGLLFGMLVVQYRSIWLAVLAHMLANGLNVLSGLPNGLQPVLERWGYIPDESGMPPTVWIAGSAGLLGIGLLMALLLPARAPVNTPDALAVQPDTTG